MLLLKEIFKGDNKINYDPYGGWASILNQRVVGHTNAEDKLNQARNKENRRLAILLCI